MKEFGKYIKFMRERKGISGRQCSIESSLSPSYISKIENGVILPSLSNFAKIVSVLGASEKEVTFLINLAGE